MAHVKTASSAKMNRDSKPKNLGVKLYAGELAKIGSIIVRQRGSKFIAGDGVKLGNDYTIYAIKTGKVEFGQHFGKKVVNVV